MGRGEPLPRACARRNATTWMWRGSIHAVSVFAVSPRPAPSTPETMTSTGPRLTRDRSNCASSSASRRRGSSRAYTSLATRWPISADSSIVSPDQFQNGLALANCRQDLGRRSSSRALIAAIQPRTTPAACGELDVIPDRGDEFVEQACRRRHIVQVAERALQLGKRVDIVAGAGMAKQRSEKLGGVTQPFRRDAHAMPSRRIGFAKSLAAFSQSPLALSQRIAGERRRRRIGRGMLEPDAESTQREQQAA